MQVPNNYYRGIVGGFMHMLYQLSRGCQNLVIATIVFFSRVADTITSAMGKSTSFETQTNKQQTINLRSFFFAQPLSIFPNSNMAFCNAQNI